MVNVCVSSVLNANEARSHDDVVVTHNWPPREDSRGPNRN